MKKKICIILIIMISLFMFSSRVEAVNMYVQCKNDYSVTLAQTTMKDYVRFTREDGETHDYGIICTLGMCNLYPLDESKCWLKSDHFWSWCTNDNKDTGKIAVDIFNKGICPQYLQANLAEAAWQGMTSTFTYLYPNSELYDNIIDQVLNPVGDGELKESSSITKTEFVVYSFKDGRGNKRIVAEGYTDDGKYAFVGPNILGASTDDIIIHQVDVYKRHGSNFWKVHEIDETRMIFSKGIISGSDWFNVLNVCAFKSVEDCKKKNEYTVLFDSRGSTETLKNLVKDWYNENKNFVNKDSNIFDVITNKNLNDTCDKINNNLSEGKSYTFSGGYPVENLITDLEISYHAIKKVLEEGFSYKDYNNTENNGKTTEISDSVVTKAYHDIFKTEKLIDLALGLDKSEHYLNENYLVEAFEAYIRKYLKEIIYQGQVDVPEINVVNLVDHIDDIVLRYMTTISYLDSDRVVQLTPEQKNRISQLRIEFEQMIKNENNKLKIEMYPVVDCKGLLGQELIDKINSYLDIIKIAVPILVIGLGVLEFTKALFAGEDDMKKAQQSFLKRIGIAIIIFFTPTLVNLILTLANKVWPIISPNSCGLFE